MNKIPKMVLTFTAFSLILCLVYLLILMPRGWSSGDDDGEPLNSQPTKTTDWVYMKVEYFHDLLTPKRFFAIIDGTTNQIPLVKGGYATTDVWLEVVVRGVDVPRALQERSNRNRPHDYIIRERQRWNAMLHYVWNLVEPTHTFRAYNFEVIEYHANGKAKVVEADIEVFLGGQWNHLAMFMLGDEHARPTQSDGSEWDFGSLNVGILNPNVPK